MAPALVGRAVKTAAVAADRVRRPDRGVVVLIYHRIGGGSGLAVDLPTALFDEQMAALAESGRVITLDAAVEALQGTAPAAPAADPIVVTFDDGTADFADVAVPILERHQIPATLYVATDFITRGISFPDYGKPLSWDAVRDSTASQLVSIGSHTHTHALLDRLEPDDVAHELDRSIELIGSEVGTPPAHFAYPKALPGSPSADAAVRARFRSAAVAGTRPNAYGKTDLHLLARSPVQTSDEMRWFHRKADGGMALEDDLRRLLNRWRYAGAQS